MRYAETDRMDMVHHSNFLVWFEAARIHMLDEIGIPYTEVEARGLFIPVLGVSLNYKRPAKFDDRIEVHLFMHEKPRARFKFEYEVRRDGNLLATGNTTHGFMDRNGKGIRPPEEFLKLIQKAWSESEG
ncbi:MAG: thioesterase family protein [Verrucomicrobiota bacterium]